MIESLPLHQSVAPEEAAPAGGVSMVQAGIDSKADHFVVVRVLNIENNNPSSARVQVQVRLIVRLATSAASSVYWFNQWHVSGPLLEVAESGPNVTIAS